MVDRKKIVSVKDANNDKPWYEFGSLKPPKIALDADGGTEYDVTDGDITEIGGVNADNPSQNVVYAVTTDGDYICHPKNRDLSQDDISIRAHLAWYDVDDGFTVLEFIEK